MDSTDEQSYKCIAYICSCAGATVLVACLATLVLYPALQETNGVNDAGAAAITALVALALFSTAIAIVACLFALIATSCMACAALCCSDSKNETNTTSSILTAPADRRDSNIV